VHLADAVAALDGLAATDYEGRAYRHISIGRAALSGEGARLHGGRWNPPRSFAVLYLALDHATVVREFQRLATKQALSPQDFLPRDLLEYELRLQHVIDLRLDAHAEALGLDGGDMAADDPRSCQLVGEAAHHAGFEALLAPSATGAGDIAAVFLDRMLPGSLVRDVARTRWEDLPGL
jgi:RES domain-containing protein